MQSKCLLEIVHAKFQVNTTIFVGATPKKVGKMSFLQHFTVFKKNFPIRIFFYLHGVKEGHFLISKPVAVMVENFFGPIKASPIPCAMRRRGVGANPTSLPGRRPKVDAAMDGTGVH